MGNPRSILRYTSSTELRCSPGCWPWAYHRYTSYSGGLRGSVRCPFERSGATLPASLRCLILSQSTARSGGWPFKEASSVERALASCSRRERLQEVGLPLPPLLLILVLLLLPPSSSL